MWTVENLGRGLVRAYPIWISLCFLLIFSDLAYLALLVLELSFGTKIYLKESFFSLLLILEKKNSADILRIQEFHSNLPPCSLAVSLNME